MGLNPIVVAAHLRPELLHFCLESLSLCRGIEQHHVYLCCNEDSDPEVFEVSELWQSRGFSLELKVRPAGWGMERANGEAMKLGADNASEYFVFIMEDERVSADFLDLADYAAKCWSHYYFSVSTSAHMGGRNWMGVWTNKLVADDYERDVEKLIETEDFGLGTVIFKRQFDKYLRPYLCEEFYRCEMVLDGHHIYSTHFHRRHFPDDRAVYLGIDGLAEKVARKEGFKFLATMVPRSHTIGFYGAHMSSNFDVWRRELDGLPLAGKIAKISRALDNNKIQSWFGPWATLFKPLLPDNEWQHLCIVK